MSFCISKYNIINILKSDNLSVCSIKLEFYS